MVAFLPVPGSVALRAVLDAEANRGVHEVGGNNAGKFVEIYLKSVGLKAGDPWCAAFVHYRLATAAGRLARPLPPDFPASGYTPDYAAWGRKHGLWIPAREGAQKAKRGDLILYYFPAKGRIAHIGMVSNVSKQVFTTVEGNTADGSGVNRDGDGVYLRTRTYTGLAAGSGFVRLPF